MNVQEYISSGVLELYVAGALSYDEMRDVERYAGQYPEIRAELNEIEKAIEAYAMGHAIAPKADTKKIFLDKISAETEKHLTTHAEVLAFQPKPSRRPFSFYLAAASIALMIVSAGAAGYFYMQLDGMKKQIAQLEEEKNRMAQDVSLVQSSVQNVRYDLGIIVHKNTKAIPIKGTKISPKAGAVVYWNSVTKDVYLNVDELPPPPSGMGYQLWAIKGGKPEDAGMLDMKSKEIHKMKPSERPEAFAVTLEPASGNAAPSKDKMFLYGKL